MRHIHRRLLGLAWPHLGPPEQITVTKGWGPLVGQTRVTCTPIGWVQVSKTSPSGKSKCGYFPFTLERRRQTKGQVIPIVRQWWGGGTTEDWSIEGAVMEGLTAVLMLELRPQGQGGCHLQADPQGWLAGHFRAQL